MIKTPICFVNRKAKMLNIKQFFRFPVLLEVIQKRYVNPDPKPFEGGTPERIVSFPNHSTETTDKELV